MNPPPEPSKWVIKHDALSLADRVLVMGVLNVTPDSFSDGGRYVSLDAAVRQAETLADEGADLLDIGGESSRPGSRPVPLDEEIARVIPVVSSLAARLPIPISIDTSKAEVARRSLDLGAAVINDVSAFRHDRGMAEIVARSGAGVILMHMQGTPATMQEQPFYADVVADVIRFLRERVDAAIAAGIDPARIAVDPGIGFGKSVEDNLTLLGRLSEFAGLGHPIVVGPSRKAFLGKLIDRPVFEREWGTAAAVAAVVLNGAHIVRVHSVKAMREVVAVSRAIRTASAPHPACPSLGMG